LETKCNDLLQFKEIVKNRNNTLNEKALGATLGKSRYPKLKGKKFFNE
jgi:hypothetical protein